MKALAQARAAGVSARDVFVPRAGATGAQIARSHTQGHVAPLYGGNNPAPIGLADYGLSANPNGNGSVVASILNTPSVMATFSPNATGIQPLYPFSSTPDGYGVQLNAVTTDVSLFGTTNYSFWTQNVVEYLAQTHELILVTNVWNFSGPALSTNAIYAHGPYGQQVGTTFYYAEEIVPTPVTYPFGLSLWMNNSVIQGRNAVNFSVALNESGVTTSYPYDYVIFNSTTLTSGPAPPSNYTANGYQYNAFGLTNDFEVILGGPGGGSQANLYAADANFTLQYWNTTSLSYRAVPSAFSYGGETGETVTGAYVGWENASNGAPVGVVRTGPAMLVGLWNATGSPGLTQVQFTLTPGNLFLFISINWTSNFTFIDQPYWAPQELTGGTFWLAPGEYDFEAMLSDYDIAVGKIGVLHAPVAKPVTLTFDSTAGIYTPLWAWNNNQLAGISTSGTGTPANPYQLFNSQTTFMPSVFGTWNDFTFPVFTGVFLFDTTASVVMSNMAPLVTNIPYANSAPSDSLGYVLYNATNVALVNSSQISGWYTAGLYNPVDSPSYAGNYYGTFSVVLWNSSGNLIANDTFATQSGGLSLYGGSNNTVWGNTFTMVPFPTFPGSGLSGLNQSLGLQEGESGDLVYDNAFDTNVTAVTVPFDLYNSLPIAPLETWNITPTPAATVNYAPNFPDFPLTGTIVGNATQGGNFWWDYGGASNPLSALPYREVVGGVAQIFTGGDSYPLIPPPAVYYPVTFTETGLPTGTAWDINLAGINSGTGSSIQISLRNGSYSWSVGLVSGYQSNPRNGTVVVFGSGANISIAFSLAPPPPKYLVTFSETGLPSGTNWSVVFGALTNSSTSSTVTFEASNGTYAFLIGNETGYQAAPPSGQLTLHGGSQTQAVVFSSTTSKYTISFSESGLPAGTRWFVALGLSNLNSTSSEINFTESSGSYGYEITPVPGYHASQLSGTVAVVASNQTIPVSFTKLPPGAYTLTFTESGLATGTSWSVTVGATTTPSTGSTIGFTETNGTYDYTIANVSGYTLNRASGTVQVAGADAHVSVGFSAIPPGKFALTFTETGLPVGTNWSVTVEGSTAYSDGGNVVSFQESGTVSYTVGSISGYTSTPASGSIDLAGSAKNIAVTFTSNSPSTTSGSGLTTLDWEILAAVVVLLIVIGLVVALTRRGRKGGEPSAPPPDNYPTEGHEPKGPDSTGPP
jgi:thermopsin